jgi:hypothetical protein
MSTYRLDRLIAPHSITLVGASPRDRSLGRVVFRNLRTAGFAGPLHLVNPHYDEIDGVTTVKDLQALPAVPDMIVVSAPASAVPDIIDGPARLALPAPSSSALAWDRARARWRKQLPGGRASTASACLVPMGSASLFRAPSSMPALPPACLPRATSR